MTLKVGPRNCNSNFASFGVQCIAPGGYVREHWHSRQEEILFCFEGAGEIEVEGKSHPFVPGTTVVATPWLKHKIINTGSRELKMTWTMTPPGLETYTFTEHEGLTILTAVGHFDSIQSRDAALATDMEKGAAEMWDRIIRRERALVEARRGFRRRLRHLPVVAQLEAS